MTRRTYLFAAIALAACSREEPPADVDNGGGTADGGILTATEGQTGSRETLDDTLDGGTLDGGTTTASGTGDETADTSTTLDMQCGESEFVLDAVPPNVILVLDRSGSMVRQTWDADQDPDTDDVTRWRSLHNVVTFIVESFNNEVNFGAQMFPSGDAENVFGAEGCLVDAEPEVPVQATNADNVLAAIPGAGAGLNRIIGGTPAARGVSSALEHLKTLDETVDRFIVLVTDGAANCNATAECEYSGQYPGCPLFEDYDEDLPMTVASAFNDDGIPTFVVGIDIADEVSGTGENDGNPDVNTFDELNEVAEAGGRPRDGAEKFFNANNEAELQAALSEIAGQVVSCTIPLDPEPEAPAFVEIEINGMTVDKITDCDGGDGWVYPNEGDDDFSSITLCGSACDMLAETGELDATYGCPPAG